LLSPQQIQDRLERILLTVQKPGRYIGGEYNQVMKDWDSVSLHTALIFPDIYDIGVPNLGLSILYQEINNRADTWAERAYAPWADMEQAMRSTGIPLYSLESKHPLIDFDLIGFTLPYETLYTNVLNILDLAQIPLKSSERAVDHPLIIAGGHAAYNPEPMAEFIDAFVIGEGEEVIHEILDVLKASKQAQASRQELLLNLAAVPGVYVPSLYQPIYEENGRILRMDVLVPGAPKKITKRIVAKLPPPPTNFIVPSIDVVHNRVSVEIMRGCTRGCRFCHAGMINRPVRERPVDQILAGIEEALNRTGFEEVALLSLSSSDYSHILELVEAVSQRFQKKRLVISLPSLRIESFSIDLMDKLKGSRQGGFTLAPEAATDRMRSIINKPIPSEQLIETARAIYSRGWQTIKLYFMIGHPSETLEDVRAIAQLCKMVIAEGRKVMGKRASLHAGVSTFVPKPHTPFQWVAGDSAEKITEKQQVLMQELRGPGLKMNWTDPRESMLESWLSRGDRRLGGVIMGAWKHGATFDSWQDKDNYPAWMYAFAEAGIDPAFYTQRERTMDEVFPWDHIDPGVKKAYLLQDYQRSLQGSTRADCSTQCYACGILPTFASIRRANPGKSWKCPEVSRRPSPAQLIQEKV
jgi:radical SAM family uncharacterized protein